MRGRAPESLGQGEAARNPSEGLKRGPGAAGRAVSGSQEDRSEVARGMLPGVDASPSPTTPGSTSRPGRKVLPLGREVPGLPLRSPPGWKRGTPWPPSLEDAEAALAGCRNAMRSALANFNVAGALAARGMAAGPGKGIDDLADAAARFDAMASSENALHFAHYRGLALYNATQCMLALPSRLAKKAAASLLVRVIEAIGDEAARELRHVVAAEAERIEAELKPCPLVWRNPTSMASTSPTASARIQALGEMRVGTWSDLSGYLFDRGLIAPRNNYFCEGPLLAVPRVNVIRVYRR